MKKISNYYKESKKFRSWKIDLHLGYRLMIFKNICLLPIDSQSVGVKHVSLNTIQVKNTSEKRIFKDSFP